VTNCRKKNPNKKNRTYAKKNRTYAKKTKLLPKNRIDVILLIYSLILCIWKMIFQFEGGQPGEVKFWNLNDPFYSFRRVVKKAFHFYFVEKKPFLTLEIISVDNLGVLFIWWNNLLNFELRDLFVWPLPPCQFRLLLLSFHKPKLINIIKEIYLYFILKLKKPKIPNLFIN